MTYTQKCPSKTSTHATTTHKPFNGQPTVGLKIPRRINDDRHHMGRAELRISYG